MEIVRALPHGHVLAALGTARRIALDAVLPRRAPQRRRDLALALIDAESWSAVGEQLAANTSNHGRKAKPNFDHILSEATKKT